MNSIFIIALTALAVLASPCYGRRGRLDVCEPCREMIQEQIEEILPKLCSFAQCMVEEHGMLTEENHHHDHHHHQITFQSMYDNVTQFAQEFEVISRQDDVVYNCIHPNLLQHFQKILCLLSSFQLDSDNSQNDCVLRLPRRFRRMSRSQKIDHVMHVINDAHRQLTGYIQVLA